jgi:hypothetical protein
MSAFQRQSIVIGKASFLQPLSRSMVKDFMMVELLQYCQLSRRKILIILEEFSMYSQNMFLSFIACNERFIHADKIVIVGDEQQLPPIDAGPAMYYLIHHSAIPIIRLVKNQRSLAIHDMPELSRLILEQNQEDFVRFCNDHTWNSNESLLHRITYLKMSSGNLMANVQPLLDKILNDVFRGNITEMMGKTLVLCANNNIRSLFNAIMFNYHLDHLTESDRITCREKKIEPFKSCDAARTFPPYGFIGMRVRVAKNNYNQRYYNGDCGSLVDFYSKMEATAKKATAKEATAKEATAKEATTKEEYWTVSLPYVKSTKKQIYHIVKTLQQHHEEKYNDVDLESPTNLHCNEYKIIACKDDQLKQQQIIKQTKITKISK